MHEGHRERLYEKLESDSNLAEHEILELVLFNSLPRINTNPLAHRLIDTFLSLDGVLSAPIEELMKVPGVGLRTARSIKVYNLVCDCRDREKPRLRLGNGGEIKNFVENRLKNAKSELVEIYCLSPDSCLLKIFPWTSYDAHKIAVPVQEIIDALSKTRPAGVIIAHNHPSAGCAPSLSDDDFTRRIQAVCSMNNINLVDHCIYSNLTGEIYSYRAENALDKIKHDISADKILNQWIKNL